jgi:Ca-activated chloride channel family protein
MDALYEHGLAKLPKSEHQQKLVKQYEERYHWPLGLAIVLLIVEFLVTERKRQPRPASASTPVSKGALQAASAVLLLPLLVTSGLASPSSALREYKAGQYDQALKEYEHLLQRNADDPRLHFNAGAAAYRNRQFDEATRQFNQAVSSSDLKLQQLSYYNRGNAQYWLGENNSDPAKRTEAWEKSIKDYELAMKLNPQDADAKFNHEFVKKRLEELKQEQQQKNEQRNIQPSEEAKKAKAEADKAVREREYSRALQVMEAQLAKDETTAYYSDYIQRLKEVTGVQDSDKH